MSSDPQHIDTAIKESGLMEAYQALNRYVLEKIPPVTGKAPLRDEKTLAPFRENLREKLEAINTIENDLTRTLESGRDLNVDLGDPAQKRVFFNQVFYKQGILAHYLTAEYCRHFLDETHNTRGKTTLKTLKDDLDEQLVKWGVIEAKARADITGTVHAALRDFLGDFEPLAVDLDAIGITGDNFPAYADPNHNALNLAWMILAANGHAKDVASIQRLNRHFSGLMPPSFVADDGTHYHATTLETQPVAQEKNPGDYSKRMNARVAKAKAGFTAEDEDRLTPYVSRQVADERSWVNKVGGNRTARGLAGAALLIAPSLIPDEKEQLGEEKKSGLTFHKVLKTSAIVIGSIAGIYLLQSAFMGNGQRRER